MAEGRLVCRLSGPQFLEALDDDRLLLQRRDSGFKETQGLAVHRDGTLHSFLTRYLRDRVLKMFETKPKKPTRKKS